MITRDEAFLEYEESMARINKQAKEASDKARLKLRGQLKVLREASHEELKAIRVLGQKIRK